MFILRLKGNRIVDPQIDGGDGRIVRAQPWVEPGDVGGAGIDMEVTVKTSLHRRTGLQLKPEAQQQGPPPIQLGSQQRVRNVSNVIGMVMWRDLQTWLGRLPARHVGPQRPPMGGTDSRPTWTLPEKAVAVVDARLDPRERPAV